MTLNPAAYKTYGISKTFMRSLLQNFMDFPEEYKDCLSKYYLLYWHPDYFCSQVKEGCISHDGKTYQIIYKKSPTQLAKCRQLKLSFRSAAHEFHLESYVLVDGDE